MKPASRILDASDLEPALLAGLLLSAGGSGRRGLQRHRQFGAEALARGAVELVPISALADSDDVLIATGVGAPGFASAVTEPEDSLLAARELIEASGTTPVAVMPGHVPGTYAWLLAAGLRLKLLDAAANGRGHPTVKLGGMGLASRPDVLLYQACVNRHTGLKVIAQGNLAATSEIMRSAAVQAGGLVMAVRGPLAASFIASHGARDAIAFQLELGHAMFAAGERGADRIEAVLACLNASVLACGEVVSNDVAYGDGFDIGRVVVRDPKRKVTLGVCNEFMTADADVGGKRLATFPDLIASVDPASGDPLAIAELVPGTAVCVLSASRERIPLGAGVFDASAYAELERAMNTELLRFVLPVHHPANEEP